MNFDESLEYLFSLGHETLAIKFGLENTQRLLEATGEPQQAFPKVQLAGTNGKGSTACMLDSMARAAGIKTGLYTSPHLVSITERISIDGSNISEEDFARLTSEVREAALRLLETDTLPALPTFFEHVTVIALRAFQAARVELAILETGLGGRLDATTAACAEVVAITPIALDHQEYLGETLEEIASEKAAIIRPGVAAIIAPQPAKVLEVIQKRCAECEVEPRLTDIELNATGADERGRLRATFKTREDIYDEVRLNLPGRHQAINASVAIAVAETLRQRGFRISREAIINGLENARHPGRLEWRGGQPAFLFDGAHNGAGARALRAYLDEFVKQPLTLVFGAMRDKDLSEMASALFPAAEHLILTEISNARTATKEMLRQHASQHPGARRVSYTNNAEEALRVAVEQTAHNGVICVTGSLYLIGEAQNILAHEEHESYAN
jgi:dihydrofolate synthase/folylpolyglutamate synthase